MAKDLPCPICKKNASATGGAYPFCSERCRLIDLGTWLNGGYVIPGKPDEEVQSTPLPESDSDS